MPIDRLSPEDRIMLWGDDPWPQEMGALAILDGTSLLDPDGRFRIEVVRRAIEGRLHLVPRFRQLLCVPRRGLGGPFWVDAPRFDIADHVQVVPPPDMADEARLLIGVEQLRRRRLDRSRPLWGMWFLPGLADGRVGLFIKMHHVIADAVAGVATLGILLDPTPEATAAGAQPWVPAPAPAPTRADLLADNLRRHIEELGRVLPRLARPVTTWRGMRAAWPAMRQALAEEPGTRTSLDRRVGAGRTLVLIRTKLDQVKEVAHAHDAKVNDVLLAATAGGLRRLLGHRGERVDDALVRIAVSISLRERRGGAPQGNLVGEMAVPLRLGVSDPGRRLRQIAAETAERKARTPPSAGALLRNGFARWVLLKAIDRQHVNVASADVPGPPVPFYLAGARVLEMFPVLPLIWKMPVGAGAISYAGQFNIMLVADRDACPDLDVVAAGMRDELHAVGVRSSPDPLGISEGRW
jgi:WS/DGAT/MGAT family acyltransferase